MEKVKKVNWKCFSCALAGTTIFLALLIAIWSFKINSSNFPEGLGIGAAFTIAAIMIIFGCHNYRLTSKNEAKIDKDNF